MNFMLDVIAKPTIILMSAAVLAMFLRRSSASLRHAVWIVAMASAILVPAAAVVVPQLEWSALPHATTEVTFLPVSDPGEAQARQRAAVMNDDPGAHRAPLQQTGITASLWLAAVWALGFFILNGRFLLATAAVRRLPKFSNPTDDWLELITRLSATFGIRRPLTLLFSEAPVSPMTWGIRRYTILLPSTAVDWPSERRRLVLAHELAHVKRHDGLLQVFLQVVCSIYWFNPLVWYAAYRVRIEREHACDDRVLSLGATAVDYADHLVQVVRGLRSKHSFSFASVSMAQPSQLESRLVSILDSRARRRKLSKIGTAVFCAVGCLTTISIAAITPQRTRIGAGDTVPNSAVTPPQVLESTPPEYTGEAVNANVEGTVTLEADVDVESKVKVLRVIKGLGYGLDEKAIEAVLGWKFRPALRNGAPVEAITQIEVDFRIPPWFKEKPKDETPPIPIGPGVTAPTIVSRVEPRYTDEARAAKYTGTVLVSATIHTDGTLTVDEVLRDLDYGLTQKAIEALEQWKFKPGMKENKAVPVSVKIEVNFRLKDD